MNALLCRDLSEWQCRIVWQQIEITKMCTFKLLQSTGGLSSAQSRMAFNRPSKSPSNRPEIGSLGRLSMKAFHSVRWRLLRAI